MEFSVYILKSAKAGKFYIGYTANLKDRLERHNAGYVPSTRLYGPWEIVLELIKENRTEAMKLEKKLKNLSRDRLLQFIEKYRN